MNITTIKRMSLLALALVLPSVASAQYVSIEEAANTYGIKISVGNVDTLAYCLEVEYPQSMLLHSVEPQRQVGTSTSSRVHGVLMHFISSQGNRDISVNVSFPGPVEVKLANVTEAGVRHNSAGGGLHGDVINKPHFKDGLWKATFWYLQDQRSESYVSLKDATGCPIL